MGRWRFFSSLGEINDLLLGDFPLPGLILNGQTWWLNYGKSPFLMGKSTISTGPFSIAMLVYQRVRHLTFITAS